MPRRPDAPAALRYAPFATADGLRLVTPDQLRSGTYEHLARGAWMVAGQEVTHGRRIQGFAAVLPADAVLLELSAAWAVGCRMAPADATVVVNVLPRGRVRGRPGLRVRAQRLPPDDVTGTPMGRATRPARTAADLLRTSPRDVAVPVVDALLRGTGTPVSAVGAVLLRQAGSRGVVEARRALELVDPRAESPRETLLRLLLLDAGLPAPVPQLPVHDGAGRLVARLDLGWPEARVGVEYDGGHHREARQHSRDLRRHNTLRRLGWVVVQVDDRGLRRADELVATLQGLLSGRR